MLVEGDMVKVFIPEKAYRDSKCLAKVARKVNGKEGRIVKITHMRRPTGAIWGTICEVEGMHSDYGIQYSFDAEWVQPAAL